MQVNDNSMAYKIIHIATLYFTYLQRCNTTYQQIHDHDEGLHVVNGIVVSFQLDGFCKAKGCDRKYDDLQRFQFLEWRNLRTTRRLLKTICKIDYY